MSALGNSPVLPVPVNDAPLPCVGSVVLPVTKIVGITQPQSYWDDEFDVVDDDG